MYICTNSVEKIMKCVESSCSSNLWYGYAVGLSVNLSKTINYSLDVGIIQSVAAVLNERLLISKFPSSVFYQQKGSKKVSFKYWTIQNPTSNNTLKFFLWRLSLKKLLQCWKFVYGDKLGCVMDSAQMFTRNMTFYKSF